MGVRRGAVVERLWLGWLVAGGLAAVLVAMRALEEWSGAQRIVGAGGAAAALAGVAWQAAAWRRAEGERRTAELVLALAYAGCALALAGFLGGSDAGLEWLGADFDSPRERSRFKNLALAASSIVLAWSILPGLAAHWAARQGGSPGGLAVDVRRIQETAFAALGTGMLAATLLLAGFAGSLRSRTVDFSYFKTSVPGDAVREIVANLDGPLQAVLFFPEINPVKDEIVAYFERLARATDNVALETYDRFEQPRLSAEYDTRADGEVFLRMGERRERLAFATEIDEARGQLVGLDGRVQRALLLLVRDERTAYATIGHGEFNDPFARIAPGSRDGAAEEPQGYTLDGRTDAAPQPLNALRSLLGLLGYEYSDLGVREGLGDRVPDDAALVMVIGPRRRFLEAETAALREYLERGGSLLFALEPGAEFSLEDYEDLLAVEADTAVLVDDVRHLRLTGGPSDARFAVTNRFSAHPAVTTAGREGATTGMAILGAVPLWPPGQSGAAWDDAVTPVVRSLMSSFVDRNGNWRYDDGLEMRGNYDLAVAVERPIGEGGRPGGRALIYGDAEMFTDPVVASLALNAAVLADGIRWLGREEEFAGQIESEEDVPIVHTRSEDVAWFYAIIFGAPLLALGAGAAVLYRRRPGSAEAAS